MFAKIVKEFTDRPLASIGSIVGLVGFVISLMRDADASPLMPKIEVLKYLILAMIVGVAMFIAAINSAFIRHNFWLGICLSPLFLFFLGFLVGDILQGFGLKPFSIWGGRSEFSAQTKFAYACLVMSGTVYLILIFGSMNKLEFGQMEKRWFIDEYYFDLSGEGFGKIVASLAVMCGSLFFIFPVGVESAWGI